MGSIWVRCFLTDALNSYTPQKGVNKKIKMSRPKKVKIVSETPIEVVDEVKEVEEISEPVAPVESEARQLLRKIYAINKSQYPKIYALKEKDKELEKKLSQIT